MRNPMRKRTRNPWLAAPAGALVALALAVPAQAGSIYSWVTEEGTFAFTDDPEKVPARYREEARERPARSLDEYERFTPEDPEAQTRYARGLTRRLQAMRELNGIRSGAPAQAAAPRAAPAPAAGAGSIALRPLGEEHGPRIDIPSGAGSEPVVVEETRYRPDGAVVTVPALVVKQGDRTLAIVKQRPRDTNPGRDIPDEDELGR